MQARGTPHRAWPAAGYGSSRRCQTHHSSPASSILVAATGSFTTRLGCGGGRSLIRNARLLRRRHGRRSAYTEASRQQAREAIGSRASAAWNDPAVREGDRRRAGNSRRLRGGGVGGAVNRPAVQWRRQLGRQGAPCGTCRHGPYWPGCWRLAPDPARPDRNFCCGRSAVPATPRTVRSNGAGPAFGLRPPRPSDQTRESSRTGNRRRGERTEPHHRRSTPLGRCSISPDQRRRPVALQVRYGATLSADEAKPEAPLARNGLCSGWSPPTSPPDELTVRAVRRRFGPIGRRHLPVCSQRRAICWRDDTVPDLNRRLRQDDHRRRRCLAWPGSRRS